MRAILSGVLRVVSTTAILITAVAIGLGRRERSIPDVRHAAWPRHQVISGFLFRDHQRDFSLLDVETGDLKPVRLAGGAKLVHASVSPWWDSKGRTHVAGMWVQKPGQGGGTTTGLVHCAGPEWSVLQLIETEQVPGSAVCWFPDKTSRILYAGRDGALYRLSFDAQDAQPEPLEWRTRRPPGLLLVSDPLWPDDPALAGLVIASMAFGPTHNDADCARRRHAELWWLKLSDDRSAIIDAGRLICPAPPGTVASDVEEGLPAISAGVDGRVTLAYLAFHKSDWTHHLRLAPLSIDSCGRPSVDGGSVVELPGNRIRSRPAFSGDGRWVCAISRPAAEKGQVERIAVLPGPRAAEPAAARGAGCGPAWDRSLAGRGSGVGPAS